MIEIGWGWIALIAFVSFLGGAVGLMVYAVWAARRKKRKWEKRATASYPGNGDGA